MRQPTKNNTRVERITNEIRERMGVCPSFFLLAADSPEIMENLWRQAQAAYLDNLLPSLFKEKLFTYLSRFCSVRYCLVRHCAFLLGRGHVAGDAACPPLTPDAALEMLRQPFPTADELDARLRQLASIERPLDAWPKAGDDLESNVFACSVPVFLRRGNYQHCQLELRRVLGATRYDQLMALLAFVRTAHNWTETHSDVCSDSDVEQLVTEQQALADWFADYPRVVEDELSRIGDETAHFQESERRFHQLAESLDQIFWLTDADKTRMLFVNSAFERIFGRTCKSLYENPRLFIDAAHPEDRQRLIDSLTRQHEGNYSIEFRIVRPDGEVRWLHTRATPVRGADGQVVRIAGISEDVTKRKQIEAELRETHELSESIIDTAQTIVLVLDTAGRIVRFNRYLEELSGWRLDEVRGRDWFDTFLPEGDREQIRGLFAQSITGERTRGNINAIVAKDGRRHDIEWNDAPLTCAKGGLIGLLCTGQDITQRQTAVQSLHDREERMRAVLDTATEAIITIDQRGIIDDVNPATERMFGYPREELVGQNVNILMPSPYCDEHDQYIARYLKTGEARIIGIGREVVGKRRDGSTFPLDLAVSEVDHLGLFTGIIRDITERVESRERLLQSERLAAIGEAMAGLAHESRNALQRSQACVDLLADELKGRPDSLELLAAIQRAQDDLHHLYEEVRTFAAPIHVRPQCHHLGEIVSKAWNDVADLWNGRDARLEECAECEDLHCQVDPFALGQVFRNIFENALHACRDPVQIRISYADLDDADPPALSITVRDNGPGISPEHASRIFHSFFTTKSSGTGLGMAIAERLVQAHHGEIALNQECEQGAEFVVTLPRKQP